MTEQLLTGRFLMKKLISCIAMLLMLSSAAFAELDTVTYVDALGGEPNNGGFVGAGSVTGDLSGVGEVTLSDIDGGDMWNGGDQFIYLHESTQRNSDFTATVRVVSQTEAVDGRWGKTNITAQANLSGNGQQVSAQIATGNGSQFDPPSSGADHNPVPVRIAGRTQDDGNGGFEIDIPAAEGTEQVVDFNNNIANNVFTESGTNATWLQLSYDVETNTFVAGTALDVNGAPGVWSFSPPVDNVPNDGDGWYVGLAYSVHNDLNITAEDGMHGVTFDNFSIVPEPSSVGLALFGFLGLLGFRRKR